MATSWMGGDVGRAVASGVTVGSDVGGAAVGGPGGVGVRPGPVGSGGTPEAAGSLVAPEMPGVGEGPVGVALPGADGVGVAELHADAIRTVATASTTARGTDVT